MRHFTLLGLCLSLGILSACGSDDPPKPCLEDGTSTGQWTMTGSLWGPRDNHTATLLPNGKVLVAGGLYYDLRNWVVDYLSSAELYDPVTGQWATAGSLWEPRSYHTATLLPNGKVLVIGGLEPFKYASGEEPASAELYDPTTDQWTTTGSLSEPRFDHTATLLSNGKVLVVGGQSTSNYASLSSAELYDPTTGRWAPAGSLQEPRHDHTATVLSNGKVLVVGGDRYNYGAAYPLSVELYDATTGQWTTIGSLSEPRASHTATLLSNGKVLAVGGGYYGASGGYLALSSAELYDPATGQWTATGSLPEPRYGHTMASLSNGKVLVVGGDPSSAELYDPAVGLWTTVGSLSESRFGPTATHLPNGKVLVAAGDHDSTSVSSAELYEPPASACQD